MKPVFRSVQDVIQELLTPGDAGFLDVRSEGEFEEASVPGFMNAPILSNEERKAVGTCYKKFGQDAAVELGVRLTREARPLRVRKWLKGLAGKNRIVVACWRGGLRSQFAFDWLRSDAPVPVEVVQGGYKAIRMELMKRFDTLPELVVITGFTGAMKSELLLTKEEHALDLETCAHHRGSSFGERETPQPSQATFENRILLELVRLEKRGFRECLVEDESVMIGRCAVPRSLKLRMNEAATIHIEATAEERVAHLVDEYALEPQRRGRTPAETKETLRKSLLRIQKSLGGLQTSILLGKLESAFDEAPLDAERHTEWLRPLLVDYYDRHYGHDLKKHGRKVLFRGNFKECAEWIQKRYD